MKVLVTGSRKWPLEEWPKIYNVLTELRIRAENRGEDFLLIHGDAEGADWIAGDWAEDNGVDVMAFSPKYDRHGPSAPHVRNDHMLGLCDYVVAFWDGKSRGTRSVVKKAINLELPWVVHSPAGVYVEIK